MQNLLVLLINFFIGEIWLGALVIMFLYRKYTKLIVSLIRVHRPKITLNMKQRKYFFGAIYILLLYHFK